MPGKGRISSLVVLLALTLILSASATAKTLPPQLPVTGGLLPGLDESAVVRAMNALRAAHGAPALGVGPALRRAARWHSQDMARRGYFDHGPFVRRLRRFGVRSWMIGENLASGTGLSAADVVQMWLESPEHRAVMLDRRFRRVGVGVAGSENRLVTADFSSG